MYVSRELKLDDMDAIMKEFKIEKYLGFDGLMVELHKKMWHVVGLAYLKMC